MKSALQRLSEWYASQCDGDWEHSYGFKISTLDNPGIAIEIDLRDTSLAAVPFEEKKDCYESPSDWMVCSRTKDHFAGRGAPGRLEDIVLTFLAWAERHPKEANQTLDPTPPS